MAVGTQLVTISAIAVSIATCIARKRQLSYEERCTVPMELPKKENKEQITAIPEKLLQRPSYALEFDGLHCFETLVAH